MWKTISNHPVYRGLRYIVINSIFAAALYYGFIVEEPIEGAKNIALFMGWVTAVISLLFMVALMVDGAEANEDKGKIKEKLAREMPKSVIPFPIDLMYDLCVTCVFIWFGHYVLAFFYIISIFVGKELRDIPKNLVLKNLKQGSSNAK